MMAVTTAKHTNESTQMTLAREVKPSGFMLGSQERGSRTKPETTMHTNQRSVYQPAKCRSCICRKGKLVGQEVAITHAHLRARTTSGIKSPMNTT